MVTACFRAVTHSSVWQLRMSASSREKTQKMTAAEGILEMVLVFTAAKINSSRQQRFMLVITSTSLRDTTADLLYKSFNFLIFNKACCSYFGQLNQYSDFLRTGRRGDRIPVRARFSALVQTVPREQTALSTVGIGTLPRA